MKVAVSGCTGFVGRHVLAELERRDCDVTCVLREASVAPTPSARRDVVRIELSLPSRDTFSAIGSPDVLIHLAWGGLPNYRSLHHFETEVPLQYRFIKQLLASGLPNLVVVGTCFEYGNVCGALTEELEARPSNPYGLAKDTLRRQLGFVKQEHEFDLTWARLFYVHGEGQAPTSLLPQLQSAVARGDKRFAMSAGEQLRDFLPVTEAARYLVDLALNQRDHGIVNVCSGRPISVRRLVEHWIEQNGWSVDLELGRYPYPEHEPMAFWGDRRKLDACLGLA